MKNILFLIILTSAFNAASQTSTYHPFPDSNATWCVESFAGGGSCNYTNIIYRLDGDSTINGLLYQRLSHYEYTERRDCINNQMTFWTDNSVTYYIRQDTSLKKIWIKDPSTHQDTLMYDFNLQVGDTINHSNTYWGDNCFNCVITSIDSVLIGGDFRTRFNYQSSCFGYYPTDTSMVEGIGGLHGLLSPPSCFEMDSRLREFTQNNITLFNNNWLGYHFLSCQTFVNVEELKFSIHSRLYPNPFWDTAMLDLSKSKGSSFNMQIYNSKGELVRAENVSKPKSLIEKKELLSGIYFFQIINEIGNISYGKFVIE